MYNKFTIYTVTSVLPVPGGPTTNVKPGYIAETIALTYRGVNLILFYFFNSLILEYDEYLSFNS